MANIADAQLRITHDHSKKTARAAVRCKITFTPLEQCLMGACSGQKMFKLKCQLWGKDSLLTGGDDFLYTYGTSHYFPDVSPTAMEDRAFDVTLGEGVLDEDWGQDEVYAKLILVNLFTLVKVDKKTNTVSHRF